MLSAIAQRNCRLILRRGVHWHERLSPQFLPNYSLPELSFFSRSLAEITRGMAVWLRSEDSAEAFEDTANADIQDLLQTLFKNAGLFGFDTEALKAALDDIEGNDTAPSALKTNERTERLRKGTYDYNTTRSITSKFIHQDEGSIAFENFENLGTISIASSLCIFIAGHWRKEFRNEVHRASKNLPEALEAYVQTHGDFPFEYQKLQTKTEKVYRLSAGLGRLE